MATRPPDRAGRKTRVVLALIVLALIAGALVYRHSFRRDVPQPAWIGATARDRFIYGSVGGERDAGIPYWIWLALPRLFPEYLPYPGGYAALGMSWEEGREMPAGFSKKQVGYVRVAANCALCHAASYRSAPDSTPVVVAVIPGHTTDLAPLLRFLKQSAADPRFNAGELLSEIGLATKLSFVDEQIYRFILIPRTREALRDPARVLLSASLRAHAADPHAIFAEAGLDSLRRWANAVSAPAYPLAINATLAAAGKPLFAQNCGTCHATSATTTASRDGKEFPASEIGTDQTSLTTGSSGKVHSGYVAKPLDGIWLRGPYLHNGAVATLRELLSPPVERRTAFFPGNDIIDSANVGFLSTMVAEPGRRSFIRYDTSAPGHSNAGHLYGIALSRQEKDALLEYLKTL